ncbi:MAG TPA: gamma-glutamylcyclotransferase family protein [Candidatus Lokiarchaeia archaeon]
MKSYNSSNLISIVGYGTFITRGIWKDKRNVKVCLVKDFVRILPLESWFPYALPLKNAYFNALKFDVLKSDLEKLDEYEGLPSGLFRRVKIEVTIKNEQKKEAYIYVPTDKTIKKYNLNPNIDKSDKWKEEIKKFPEIVKIFPELLL